MSDDKHHDVVIIKRGGGDHEDGHHGGAWKIAFADFMTAMMAFFLVMWLISASDKTKAVIAHYFNPVQLVDSTPQPKGLQDMQADAQSIMKYASSSQTDHTPAKDESNPVDAKAQIDTDAAAPNKDSIPDKTAKHEAQLFRDPYAVLAEIAAKDDTQPKISKRASSEGVKGGSGAIGLKGGEAFRDPFEPLSQPPIASAANPEELALAKSVAEAVQTPPAAAEPPPSPAKDAGAKVAKAEAAKMDSAKADGAKSDAAKPDAAKSDAAKAAPTPAQGEAQVAALRAKLEAAMQQGTAPGSKDASEPKLDVRRTSEGLVIGLTDDANFAMFASASAEPAPKMVALMAKIGRLLKTEKGMISVRGFTDNRPFRSDVYDNWQLSTARADIAHYMLVRGGLDDTRIEKIEGYADRRPKNPKDPGAAENRRIEILLRENNT